MLLHLPLLLALSAAVSEGATFGNQAYDGQKLAAVHVESLQQIGAVEQLVSDVLGIQRRAENDNTHMVHVRGLAEDLDGLREHGFEVDILSDSVADYIADAEAVESHHRHERAESFHSKYHSYAEIIAYLKSLASSTKNSSVVYGEMSGETYEGRKIPVLAIGNSSAPYAIYLQANIHAREWISSSSLLYATEQLISSYSSSPYANKIRLYISPMANPDGYEYSRTTDRLWRQNRSPNGGCDGVDLNRNFDGFNSWEQSRCGQIYSGPSPFSENETKSISAFLKTIKTKQRLVGIIDFHNFAQWILWPPGYPGAPNQMPDGKNLAAGGNAMKDAIQKGTGTLFSATTANEFYPAGGAFDDWSYENVSQSPNTNAAIDKGLVYTIELPPMDGTNPSMGFILPADQIVPVGKQVYIAIDTLAKYIMSNNVPK